MRPWYCVQSLPRQETYAAEQLSRQLGITTFQPNFLVKKKDRHITVKSLFNSYFFISTDDEALWPRINNIPGVSKVITYLPKDAEYARPSAIASEAIECLRALALTYDEIRRGGKRPIPQQYITEGCYVKVLDGVFRAEAAAQRALVEWADTERAQLTLDMFNRKVKVEFYLRDLQLVD